MGQLLFGHNLVNRHSFYRLLIRSLTVGSIYDKHVIGHYNIDFNPGWANCYLVII